jgi:3-oxoacyl-[acyl-carrier protein] reductase
MEVDGRGAIVAGGAGSLGRVIVAGLRQRGAAVVVLDSDPNPAPFDDTGVTYISADVSDEDSVSVAVAKAADALGKIAILVNAAGAIHSEPLFNMLSPDQKRHRLDSWERVLRSNLTTTFLVTSHVVEAMATSRTKGVIVNFSSVAAAGNPGQSAYAAAKAGIEALTAVWAKELGPLGIRVVAVAPGFVDTPSTRAALPEATIKEWARRTPLRRLATAEEIASAVLFAIENDYLTGRVLAIDGGLTI